VTGSEVAPKARTTSMVVRVLLGILAVTEAVVGVWALFAPVSFYNNFPTAGHAWVSLLPPYNEHLVRDVGALSLCLTVLLAAAALTGHRLLGAVAIGSLAVYAVPHAVFHALHLEGFGTFDAVAQMAGIGLHLVVIGVVAWLLWRDRARQA
jgi:fucose 4-O-acetylase-like acetyltransferase